MRAMGARPGRGVGHMIPATTQLFGRKGSTLREAIGRVRVHVGRGCQLFADRKPRAAVAGASGAFPGAAVVAGEQALRLLPACACCFGTARVLAWAATSAGFGADSGPTERDAAPSPSAGRGTCLALTGHAHAVWHVNRARRVALPLRSAARAGPSVAVQARQWPVVLARKSDAPRQREQQPAVSALHATSISPGARAVDLGQ